MDQLHIYYERQRGGLCRLHALNAFFGKAKITEPEFKRYAGEMDEHMRRKYHVESCCLEFDAVFADHNSLVVYVLKKFGYYARYLAINELHKDLDKNGKTLESHLTDLAGDFFFIYNANHIWGAKRVVHFDESESWYAVDSNTGVRRTTLEALQAVSNTGFIIPVNKYKEFYKIIDCMRKIIGTGSSPKVAETFSSPKVALEQYLIYVDSKRLILGDLETPLNIAIDILDTVLCLDPDKASSREFAPVQNLVQLHREFLDQFTPDRYHDLRLKLHYIPNLVLPILQLTQFRE